MHLRVTANDGVPIYLQIVNQVKYLVAAQRLAPGEALPSVRRLAEQLVVNPNTVARAYRELEYAGVVSTRGRNGTVVTGGGSERASKEAAASYAEAMRALGVRQDEALELVRRAFDRPVSS